MYLIDSDRTIDWLKGSRDAVAFLGALQGPLYLSLISLGEIYEGIYASTQPDGDEAVFLAFLRQVELLQVSRPIMQRFAEVRSDLRRAGLRIGDMDLLIAATALHHNLTLVTRNVRDFEKVRGLRLL